MTFFYLKCIVTDFISYALILHSKTLISKGSTLILHSKAFIFDSNLRKSKSIQQSLSFLLRILLIKYFNRLTHLNIQQSSLWFQHDIFLTNFTQLFHVSISHIDNLIKHLHFSINTHHFLLNMFRILTLIDIFLF